MAKAKTHSELFIGLLIIAVIGAVFLAQTTKQPETVTGSAVYPVYAAASISPLDNAIAGTLDIGGNGICETYSWGAQLKMADGKSLGAKFNVCSDNKHGFNYQCSLSVRSYVYPREIGLVCDGDKVCDIVAGKASCVSP